MEADGSNKHLVSPILFDYSASYVPAWSPNSQYLAFAVQSVEAEHRIDTTYVPNNLYVADVASGETTPVTFYDSQDVRKPFWSTDSTQVTAMVSGSKNGSARRSQEEVVEMFAYEPTVITLDGRQSRRLPLSPEISLISGHVNPAVVWLATGKEASRLIYGIINYQTII